MAILIADSGSTKTDWCLAEKGVVMETVTTQGINPFLESDERIENVVENELFTQIATNDVEQVYYYGSGCRSNMIERMNGVLGKLFPLASTQCYSDLTGAARALCGNADGIVCILGTGSNSCVYEQGRITANVPPLGYILGDEGSGAALGKMLVNALFKGRLTEQMSQDFMHATSLDLETIIKKVYREPMANRFLASLSRYVYRNKSNESLSAMVKENFRQFFINNIERYKRRDLAVNAIGSIAFFYRDELKQVAKEEGYEVKEIMQRPMKGLVKYHSQSDD